MSRQRFIFPEIITSEDFTTLSLGARLLFIGLIATADDYGRGRGGSRCMKAAVFPADDYTPNQVAAWADEIGQRQTVQWYEVHGGTYYQIIKWDLNQKPKYKAESKIPCIQHDAGVRATSGPLPGQISPEPGTNPETGSGSGSGSGEEKRKIKPSSSPKSGDGFEAFWQAYPRKVGKRAASKAWSRLNGTRPDLEIVLKAVERASRSADWTKDAGQFIPHPTTWLNQGRWDDQPAEKPQINSPTDSWGRPVGYAE